MCGEVTLTDSDSDSVEKDSPLPAGRNPPSLEQKPASKNTEEKPRRSETERGGCPLSTPHE